MFLVDHLQLGPFSSAYHRALVDDAFVAVLQRFLEDKLLPQVDTVIQDVEGSLAATYDSDRYCGPTSLVRNILTLEMAFHSSAGTSDLKADIVFDPSQCSFSARPGHNHFFYLWTPNRKAQRQLEMESIQRRVDDIQHHRPFDNHCPLCGGDFSVIDNPLTFDVRCRGQQCFAYHFHKDEKGKLTHGHFLRSHPEQRLPGAREL